MYSLFGTRSTSFGGIVFYPRLHFQTCKSAVKDYAQRFGSRRKQEEFSGNVVIMFSDCNFGRNCNQKLVSFVDVDTCLFFWWVSSILQMEIEKKDQLRVSRLNVIFSTERNCKSCRIVINKCGIFD